MRALLLIMMMALSVQGEWSTDPDNPAHVGSGIFPQIAKTSDGGSYIAWLTPGSFHIYLQRLDVSGNPQWTTGGLLVSDATNSSWIAVYHLNLLVDGDDNAIISSVDTRTGNWEVYIYKIDPEGIQLWGDNGLTLSNSGNDNISPRLLLEPSDNSVIVTWSDNYTSLRLQRVSATGQLLWGEIGLVVSTFNASYISPQAVKSADDQILVQAIRQTGSFPALSSQVAIQKYTLDGIALWSGWTQVGSPVGFPLGNWLQGLAPDITGGAFASWTQMTTDNQTGKVQRITSDGDEAWTSPLDVSDETNNFRISPQVVSLTETSDVYTVWGETDANQVNRGLFAQKIDASGVRQWDNSGFAIEAMGGQVFFDRELANWNDDLLTVYIRQAASGNKDVVATRIQSDASYTWPNDIVSLTNSGAGKSDLVIAPTTNHVVVAWSEGGDIKAHCLLDDGSLGVPQTGGQLIEVPLDFTTVQSAIVAAENGDSILVHPGTYFEQINFLGKDIVVGSLFLTTGDTSYIAATMLHGGRVGTVVTFNSGEGPGSELTGLTVKNGLASYADPDGDGDSSSYGGGIYCENASPILRHLYLINNWDEGGGGGGLFCYQSSPTIESVTFDGNSTQDVGGAIYAKANCNISINNSTFLNNTCPSVGAAIYARDSSSLALDRVLMVNNNSEHAGGGIGLKAGCEAILTNVTLADNFALHHGAGLYSNSSKYIVINSILWGNEGGEVYFADFDDPSQILLSHSTIQDSSSGINTNENGTVTWEAGNMDQDPLFMNVGQLDFSLTLNSPSVDTGIDILIMDGDTLLHISENDFEGPAPDMGTYELMPMIVNYFPLMVNSGWVLASDIDTIEIVMIDSNMIEGNQYHIFSPEYPYYPFESINPFRVDGNQVKVWTGEADEILYDIGVPLNTSWAFNNAGVWENSQVTLSSYGETIETETGTYENCYGFHRFIGADYEYYDWLAPGAGLVQRDVITFAGPRRYRLISFLSPVDIDSEQSSALPQQFQLQQNFPNPFNPSTSIRFELPSSSKITLTVFDLNGRMVKSLYEGEHESGDHSMLWAGDDQQGVLVAAGIYVCRLETKDYSQSMKMVFLK